MKEFMNDDFLLQTDTAKWLYHDVAKFMPVFDFHNHLSAKEIYENENYKNIAEVWLGHDHYKWRAMRSNGIEEKFITGDSSDYDKYLKWAGTMPRLIGSPLYHWNHLEMRRYFGYEKPLSNKTAKEFWDLANEKLESKDFSPRELLVKMNVVDMCTTDDPIDDLKYHRLLADEEKRFKVRPTFRPDKALNINKDDYVEYINKLGEVVGYRISTYDTLLNALRERLDYFEKAGCRISDHSLEGFVYYSIYNLSDCKTSNDVNKVLDNIMDKKINGREVTVSEEKAYRSQLLIDIAREYQKRGFVMQLHIGAMRNNSTRRHEQIGVDSGFDSVDDISFARELSEMLDTLDRDNNLPKTIIYNLNSKDNCMLATLMGNFQNEDAISKIQLGAAWWFLDHKRGMENQLQSFAESGVLADFVGMVTDSRSMLSFPRHEYFRRILCNYIGNLVENGEYPEDRESLKTIIEDICYNNIVRFVE